MKTDSALGGRSPVAEEYARLAADYDRRWRRYLQITTRCTLAQIRLQAGERVLDVGCGTGLLLREISRSQPAASLAGVDLVPEMLAVAASRLPAGVALHRARVERLPFADAAFDVVTCCNMFHYIEAPQTALHEIRRVLRPGGCLVLTDWCRDALFCRLLGVCLNRFGRTPVRIHTVRECAILLRNAGFVIEESERYRASGLWGLMTLRARRYED